MPENILERFRNIKKFNWVKSYLEADISVKADIKIIDYGKHSKTPKGKGKPS